MTFDRIQMALVAIFTWVFLRRGLPSTISIGRLASIWYLPELFHADYRLAFYVAAILAALSDWIDGVLARVWKCESKIGGFFDLLGDKALSITLMYLGWCLWGSTWWYVVPCVCLFVYHLVVMSLRVIGAMWPRFSWTIMPASLRVAKIKFFVEACGLIACFASFGLDPLFVWVEWLELLAIIAHQIGLLAVWIATALAAWSMLGYLGYLDDWPEELYPRQTS